MELECEYMTPFGCPARDTAKELMLLEMIESNKFIEMCKKQCCKDCDEVCCYRCNNN